MDENWGYLQIQEPTRVESVIPFGEFHMHKYPTRQQRLLVEVRVDKEHVRANSNNDEDTQTHPETLKGTYVYRRFIPRIARRDLCLPWTIQWNPMD